MNYWQSFMQSDSENKTKDLLELLVGNHQTRRFNKPVLVAALQALCSGLKH